MTEQLFQVGVKAFVRRDDGRVLLLREANHPDSYWDLPGGRMDPDETITQTLVRELREEICVDYKGIPRLISAVKSNKVIRDERGEFALMLIIFDVNLKDSATVRPGEEGTVLEWFTPRDAADKLRDKFSEEFLKYVRELN